MEKMLYSCQQLSVFVLVSGVTTTNCPVGLRPVWMSFVQHYEYACLGVLSTGYRSVPLRNGYSEKLELASLLVHIDAKPAGVSKPTQPLGGWRWWRAVCICDHFFSLREWRRTCIHHLATWERSRRSAMNHSCMTRTPTSCTTPFPANRTTF